MEWQMTEVGSMLVARLGKIGVDALAGGSGDNTEVECAIIDLVALGNPQSCKVLVPWEAVLADTETISLALDMDHGADSGLSDAAQYAVGQAF